MKHFFTYTFPWIVAALVLIAVPVAAKSSYSGYETIEFRSPVPAAEQTPQPSHNITPEQTPQPSHNIVPEQTPQPSHNITPEQTPQPSHNIAPEQTPQPSPDTAGEYTLVLNLSTGKIHLSECRYTKSMNEESRKEITTDDIDETLAQLEEKGYTKCRVCIGKNE